MVNDPKQQDSTAPTKPTRDENGKKRQNRDDDKWVDDGELPDVIPGGEGQERAANVPDDEDDEVRQGT